MYSRSASSRGTSPNSPATTDVVAEDPLSGFCGAVVACTSTAVTLEDRAGRRRLFPLTSGAFLVDGRQVTLVRPRPAAAGTGAVRVRLQGGDGCAGQDGQGGADLGRRASMMRPWWNGSGGTTCGSRASSSSRSTGWTTCRRPWPRSGPGDGRRLGVLVDHLVPRSKESRIADAVLAAHRDTVLITGHPTSTSGRRCGRRRSGIAAWPDVPRGIDWKTGVCAALGMPDTRQMWGRVNGAVRSYRDLDTPLITAVERLIDFVAQP